MLAPWVPPRLLDAAGDRLLSLGDRAWSAQLERLIRPLRTSERVLVGPWLTEVGFELLYWIPFLRWLSEQHLIERERLLIVSRGGVGSWYSAIADDYVDIFDYFSADQFRVANEQRAASQGGALKHRSMSTFDRQVVERVRANTGLDKLAILHPSLMYRVFQPVWLYRAPPDRIEQHTMVERLMAPPRAHDYELPRDYVAAKFYFNASFPDTPRNRALVADCLERLASITHVVLLQTHLHVDDHDEYASSTGPRLHVLPHELEPATNLAVQSSIVAHAQGFVGTYGGFSYLAPLYGVPAVALLSRPEACLPHHRYFAEAVLNRLGASYVSLNPELSDPLASLGAALGARSAA